jgi:ribonucleotide monophosphatase NagD (HAD superfamily)
MSARWVCFDVGETLIDETRIWSTWADILGLPRFTFLAAIGGAIARGRDFLAMSDALGVAKPEPAFFTRLLALLGDPEPGAVAYVGDRVDNDVEPARAAGLRAGMAAARPVGAVAG